MWFSISEPNVDRFWNVCQYVFFNAFLRKRFAANFTEVPANFRFCGACPVPEFFIWWKYAHTRDLVVSCVQDFLHHNILYPIAVKVITTYGVYSCFYSLFPMLSIYLAINSIISKILNIVVHNYDYSVLSFLVVNLPL